MLVIIVHKEPYEVAKLVSDNYVYTGCVSWRKMKVSHINRTNRYYTTQVDAMLLVVANNFLL